MRPIYPRKKQGVRARDPAWLKTWRDLWTNSYRKKASQAYARRPWANSRHLDRGYTQEKRWRGRQQRFAGKRRARRLCNTAAIERV